MGLPEARHALFLDFDGTLVDIAPRPDAVRVREGLAATLQRLAGTLDGALAIVTGRPIAVIDDHLAPHAFDVAGLHGADIRVGGRDIAEPDVPPAFRHAVAGLQADAAAAPGLIVEDKGASVALHWRLAPERRGLAEALAQRTLALLGEGWKLQTGKAVLEIVSAAAGKGRAIARLLECPAYAGRRPVFIGDDDTDENGFAEVLRHGGIAVRVGPGQSCAPLRIADPLDLAVLLAAWAATGICPFDPATAGTAPETPLPPDLESHA